jgi:hypothetical protein
MEPLQRLLIERACERLCVDYARRVDARDGSLADLFTEDAVLTLVNVDLHGPGEILAYIRRSAEEQRVSRHLCCNITIDVEDVAQARGAADMTYFTGRPQDGVVRTADLRPAGVGTYHDVYRLTPDGWRIASRRFAPAFLRQAKPKAAS